MNPNNWGGGMGGGVGRGMPNMNMGMSMGMGNNMNMNMNPNMQQQQQQQQQQQRGPNFLGMIYQNLTASQGQDGPFTGWRSHVSIQERAGQVKILFDSLRMLGAAVDIRRSLDIAVAFERRQFLQSASLEAYKQSLHEKLSSIRDQRQHQAQVSANSMPNNMQMMNPAFQQAQQQQPQMNQMTPNMNFQQPSTMQPTPSLNPMVQQRPMNVSLHHRTSLSKSSATHYTSCKSTLDTHLYRFARTSSIPFINCSHSCYRLLTHPL